MTRLTAPPPPTRPANKPTAQTVALALEMYGNGDAWTPSEIHRYLNEHDVSVSVTTVQRWIDPAYAERQRAASRRSKARREGRAREAMTLDERMLELRGRGLSYAAIRVVVEIYHDAALTEHQVRGRLRALGVQPVAGKSAVMRRKWAEQKLRHQGGGRAERPGVTAPTGRPATPEERVA